MVTRQPPASATAPARCAWAGQDPLLVAYHDREWGVPIRDERRLFALLNLEGAQAGLAWITILRKRDAYHAAFEGWDPRRMAAYDEAAMERLLTDPGIVRNRAKVRAAIGNARALLRMADAGESLAGLAWSAVDGTPVRNAWRAPHEVPALTDASRGLSRELQRRGFRFVGPTIVYAFMQSAGLVNDHLVSCFRHAEVGEAA